MVRIPGSGLQSRTQLWILWQSPKGGYSAVGLETVAASIEGKSAKGKVDAVESFVFNGMPSQFVKPGADPNPSPLFPKADDYLEKVTTLRVRLHRLCCLSLGIANENFFEDSFYDEAHHTDALRFAYYPPPDDAAGAGADPEAPPQLRYGAHTDYQDLTVLKPDYNDWTELRAEGGRGGDEGDTKTDAVSVPTTGGLQILKRDAPDVESSWEAVIIHHDPTDPEIDAPLIINIGDFWNAWTADRWRSPLHRVTKSGTFLDKGAMKPQSANSVASKERQAIVYFSIPKDSSMIEPLCGSNISSFSQLGEEGSSDASNPYHPNNYTPVRSSEHLAAKIARSNA